MMQEFVLLGKLWNVNKLSKLNDELKAVVGFDVEVTTTTIGKKLEVVIPLNYPTQIEIGTLPEAIVLLLIGSDNMPPIPHFPGIDYKYEEKDIESNYKDVAKERGLKIKSVKFEVDKKRGIILNIQ